MTITITLSARGTTAAVAGRLDLKTANDLRLQASEALAEADDTLVLDLAGVDFIDSSGLGALIGLHLQAAREGKRLEIIPPTGVARELFALTRTEHYFTLIGRPGQLGAK
jgi:anti-anti-sigma factor